MEEVLHFRERFFHPLHSSLQVNCTCIVHFPLGKGDEGFDRVIAAIENKLLWPEVVGDEICIREVSIPYNSDAFCITGLHNIFSPHTATNYLYLTLSPRDVEEERCHVLCFSLQYQLLGGDNVDPELSYDLTLHQDLSCGYCPLDMQHILYENPSCIKTHIVVLAIGSDKYLHMYDMDLSNGLLHRVSATSPHTMLHREWAQRLDLPLYNNIEKLNKESPDIFVIPSATSQAERGVPLRLLVERWHESVDGDENGTQGLVGHVDGLLSWDRLYDTKGSVLPFSKSNHNECNGSDSHVKDQDIDPSSDIKIFVEEEDPKSLSSVPPTLVRQVRHHYSASDDESNVPILSAVTEEDEEDDESSDGADALLKNMLLPSENPVASACRKFQHLLTFPTITNDLFDRTDGCVSSKTSLLLDGCVSCMKFYRRESIFSRNFRRTCRCEGLTSTHTHVNIDGVNENYRNKVLQCTSRLEPSPSVLVGLSEGTVALLSLCSDGDRGQVQSLLLSPHFITNDTSVEKSSCGHGIVTALCVADVTDDNANEVIVGYEDGYIRVAKLCPETKEVSLQEDAGVDDKSDSSIDIATAKLPFPIVNVEFGHFLLGNKGEKISKPPSTEDLAVYGQHLIVHTTQSVHIFSVQYSESHKRINMEKEMLIKRILKSCHELYTASTSKNAINKVEI